MTLRTFPYRRALILVSIVAVVAAGASAAFAATDSEYSVAISNDDTVDLIDVPTTTYTTDGETIEVTRFGRTAQEGTLTFEVDAPAGEYYTVRIVNGEGTAVETKAGTGDDTFEMYPENYPVGTYVIAVTDETGDQREVHTAEPFVVRGYTVTQEAQSTVESDGTLRVDVSIAPEDSPPEFTSVTVAVGDDSTRVVQNATRINDTAYYAEFDAGQFEDGEYTVVSGVRGDLAFDGTAREYYGISDAATVRVGTDSETATDTETGTDGEGGSGGGSTGGSSTATTTATATSTPGTTTATSPAENATATPTGTEPASDGTATATAGAGGSETVTTTAGPTTGPTTTPPESPSTTDGGTDGGDGGDSGGSTETTGALFHPLGVLLLFVVSVAALRRQT